MFHPQYSRPPGVRPRHAAPLSPGLTTGIAAAVLLVLVGGIAVVASSKHDSHPVAADQAGRQVADQPVADQQVAATVVPPARGAAAPASAPGPATPTVTPTPSAATKGTEESTKTAAVAAGVPAAPAGFTLTYADSFAGVAGTGLNTSKYRYDTGPGGGFGTGEIETMTDSTRNVFHDGYGHLVLRAVHTGTDPGRGWTSGRIETEAASFGAAQGGVVRMQASIQQPGVTEVNGAGYWPAFWMLGDGLRNGGAWPGIGEVDILESINARSSIFGTLHCGSNPGGPCNESSGVGSGEHACAGCQTGFHTYAVEIDRSSSPERIRWYLDGDNYFTLTQDRIGDSAWTAAVDHPFFIIFDLAMGGGFPAAFGGGPDAGTVGSGAMKIDYLAVYNED